MLATRKRLAPDRTRVERCKADTRETQKTSTTSVRLPHWNQEVLNIHMGAKEETPHQKQAFLDWQGIVNKPASIRSMLLATSLTFNSKLLEQVPLRKRTLLNLVTQMKAYKLQTLQR